MIMGARASGLELLACSEVYLPFRALEGNRATAALVTPKPQLSHLQVAKALNPESSKRPLKPLKPLNGYSTYNQPDMEPCPGRLKFRVEGFGLGFVV